MLIDFYKIKESEFENMNGGSGIVFAKMFSDKFARVIVSRIPVGASIGKHIQKTGNDLNFVASGTGVAFCDGKQEKLIPGVCHICPKGSEHLIINDGKEDLVLYTVIF